MASRKSRCKPVGAHQEPCTDEDERDAKAPVVKVEDGESVERGDDAEEYALAPHGRDEHEDRKCQDDSAEIVVERQAHVERVNLSVLQAAAGDR